MWPPFNNACVVCTPTWDVSCMTYQSQTWERLLVALDKIQTRNHCLWGRCYYSIWAKQAESQCKATICIPLSLRISRLVASYIYPQTKSHQFKEDLSQLCFIYQLCNYTACWYIEVTLHRSSPVRVVPTDACHTHSSESPPPREWCGGSWLELWCSSPYLLPTHVPSVRPRIYIYMAAKQCNVDIGRYMYNRNNA